MSSKSGIETRFSTVWETPQELFDQLDSYFHFDLDVCALPENAKCERYFTPEMDGLSQTWTGTCWMNPPYGREIGAWLEKAYVSSRKGATVVCLIPSKTDTKWWHEFVTKGEIGFIRGRLHFGTKDTAPFSNTVVVFRPESVRKPKGRVDGRIFWLNYSPEKP